MITNRRLVDNSGSDFYPTPSWATIALAENEKFEGEIWEPACGNGAMSEILSRYNTRVLSTDLNDNGYGLSGVDFLTKDYVSDNIVTNPPYNIAEDFVHAGLRKSRRKFCLLMRLAFLEGSKRANSIYLVNPPARVWVFSERITFYRNGDSRAGETGNGTTAYAWIVWDKEVADKKTEMFWFKPGYKKMI